MNEQPISTSSARSTGNAPARLRRLREHLPALMERFQSFHDTLRSLSTSSSTSSQDERSDSSTQLRSATG